MTLTLCSDLSAAGWLTASDGRWDELVCFGPAGFPAYARLRFIPDPVYEGQSENDVDLDEEALSETAQLRMVLDVLSRYTRTPSDCYFCLWDGWGLHEISGLRTPDVRTDATGGDPRSDPSFGSLRPLEAVPAVDSSLPPPVLREAMVVVPNRSYLLFHGAVADLGERGSATRWPGQPSLGTADPAFIWPADHAWCVANDVDPHWAGIGAAASAIAQLVADPRVDVVLADPRAHQPRYR